MYMSVVADRLRPAVYPDLAGARVLLTGLTEDNGVDVARAFAEHKGLLILQSSDPSPAVAEIAALVSETAADVRFYQNTIATAEEARQFAQQDAQAFGGVDVAINLVTLSPGMGVPGARVADVERLVARALNPVVELTRIIANRMRITWAEGLILNIVTPNATMRGRDALVAGMVHATLATMTRQEAKAWAEHAIRVNAVGPGMSPMGCEPPCGSDIAELALYLASRKGRGLSGHVFDPDSVC